MPGAATLLEQGWLFIPSAILLGALHGLEPGHAKTMMAAFIVAVRGTVGQAVLLGVAATVSHTLIVWIVALGGTALLAGTAPDAAEPYFRLASAVLIVGIAVWMMATAWRRRHRANHDHIHGPAHDHDHGHAHRHKHGDEDAHTLAHAVALERRLTQDRASTAQVVAFGLSGGLIPCAGAITILLLCLQLQKIALGAVLVLSFSVGLAATLVLSGIVAAIGIGGLRRRWPGFDTLAGRAPYLSGAVTLVIGLYLGHGVLVDLAAG